MLPIQVKKKKTNNQTVEFKKFQAKKGSLSDYVIRGQF